ncbi:hypothetical protein GCM10027429_01650 [Marivirga atlantica]|jgi:hypothetical protein|uniref:Uncharacterized protein n=1 Tax=Marivirga atlantica TaxID=1548457 RepID=A0A937A540_9BACT|nr:hypothetical protein [Marivirga atlantica]MBL0763777.1 hypothetical protein [Marivirga atlantica]
MRKYLLLALILTGNLAFGQKYKEKKGVLLKDKEPMGQIVGTVNLAKATDLAIIQDGDTAVTIKQERIFSDFSELRNFSVYTLDFKQLGEEIKVIISYNLVNEKQIMKYIFAENDIHIYKDGFKIEEIEAAREKKSVKEVQNKLDEFYGTMEFWKENIANNRETRNEDFDKILVTRLQNDPEDRPKNLPAGTTQLIWKKVTDKTTAEEYRINDKNVWALIGAAVYTEKISQASIGNKKSMKIYLKLDKPKKLYGEMQYYVPFGYVDLLKTLGEDEILLYSNGEKLKYEYDYKDSPQLKLNKMVDALEAAGELY